MKANLILTLLFLALSFNSISQNSDSAESRYSLGLKTGLQRTTYKFTADTSLNPMESSSQIFGIEYQRLLGKSSALVIEFNYASVEMIDPKNPRDITYSYSQFDLPVTLRLRSQGNLKLIGDLGIGLCLLNRNGIGYNLNIAKYISDAKITYHIGAGFESNLTKMAAISIIGRYQNIGSKVDINNFNAQLGLKLYMPSYNNK
ncbi:MAG: outer membrane beta-barrel protein [Chitinophagales bacterium]|nr:outer membrane beta-barrel protein [Chitinophagales bacterium]